MNLVAMESLIHDETSIHYVSAGNALPTLLFVHGADIDLTYWDAQMAYFKEYYKVIAIDLPGHGQSGRDKQRWTVEDMGKDVAVFIKSLKLEQVILIAHSMGGSVGLVAATTYPNPIIGFIGIDNFKSAGQPLPSEYQEQSKQIIEQLHQNFADTNEQYVRMALTTPQTPESVSARVINDYRNAYQPMATEILEAIFKNGYLTERKLLPKLACRLHLINVDYMPTQEEPLQTYTTKGYAVHHMEGTSHFPMIEKPDEFNRLLAITIKEIRQEMATQV